MILSLSTIYRRPFSIYRKVKSVLKNTYMMRKQSRFRFRGQPIKVQRVGSVYGGGWVATSFLHPNSLVYSVGIGEEISFDEELHDLVPCKIVGFDPTPRASEFIKKISVPKNYLFIPVGIASTNGLRRFYFPADLTHVSMSLVHDAGAGYIDCDFLTLENIMSKLGHKFVDLIKIDIEGEEYSLIKDWLSRDFSPPVGQMWIEFHPPRAKASDHETRKLVQHLKKLGFIPFFDGRSGYLFLNAKRLQVSLFAQLLLCLKQGLVPV